MEEGESEVEGKDRKGVFEGEHAFVYVISYTFVSAVG